jgi:hypothetical protein
MTGALSVMLHSIDLTSPFAEDAFAEETICEFALEIQETEFRFLSPLWRDVIFLIIL